MAIYPNGAGALVLVMVLELAVVCMCVCVCLCVTVRMHVCACVEQAALACEAVSANTPPLPTPKSHTKKAEN